MGDLRQLAWRDRWLDYDLSVIPQDTTGDSPDNDLQLDLDNVNYLVLAITGKEYTEMLSALIVGADFSYSELSHGVVWPLLKAAKMATFCDTVAACILNSANVQAALEAVLSNGAQNGGVGSPTNELSSEILDANWMDGLNCDDNKLWGACQQIIDGVFDATIEVLERVNLAASPIDQVAELLDAIPIVGGLLSFAVGTVAWAADYAYDIFIAADSAVVREQVACELFCLARGDCEVTMNMVFSVLTTLAGSAPPVGTDYLTQMEWLFGLDVASSPALVAASAISLLGAITVKFGGKFGNTLIGVRSLQQLAALGAVDFPNSGWAILCTGCSSCDTVTGEFSTAQPGSGTYIAGEWTAGYYQEGATFYRGCDLVRPASVGIYPNRNVIRINYTLTKGTSDNVTMYVITYKGVTLESKIFSQMENGTFEVAYDTGEIDLNGHIRILIRCAHDNNNGDVVIHSVRFCDS